MLLPTLSLVHGSRGHSGFIGQSCVHHYLTEYSHCKRRASNWHTLQLPKKIISLTSIIKPPHSDHKQSSSPFHSKGQLNIDKQQRATPTTPEVRAGSTQPYSARHTVQKHALHDSREIAAVWQPYTNTWTIKNSNTWITTTPAPFNVRNGNPLSYKAESTIKHSTSDSNTHSQWQLVTFGNPLARHKTLQHRTSDSISYYTRQHRTLDSTVRDTQTQYIVLAYTRQRGQKHSRSVTLRSRLP